MSLRSVVAWLVVGLLGAGCEDGTYVVRVLLPGDPSRATRVDVHVLGACQEVDTPGDPPFAPLVTVEALAGEPLGDLAPGSYGLYGRAWEMGCLLYAAGCAPIRVEAGGEGTLTVRLQALPSPRGCDPGEACHDDVCVPGDEDDRCERDTDCDDDIDCTRDLCPDDGECVHVEERDRCEDDEICFAAVGCIPLRPCEDASDCDDGNFCSGVEACHQGTCVPGEPVTCDDGDACNGVERCDADLGECVPGDPPSCNDGIDCTVDGCEDGECTSTPDDARCGDEKFCNGEETCDATDGCLPGVPPCDDAADCSADECVEADQECLHHGDHRTCLPGEVCVDAGAGFSCDVVACDDPADCDDGDACNGVETCGPDGACVPSDFVPCDDGVFCNGAEFCADGACEGQAPPGCSDGVACTVDACDALLDACVSTPADDLCDDGLTCTLDACGALGCEGPPRDCDDGSACTVDGCSEQAGGCTASVIDADGDGRGDAACGGIDCDDADPFRFPGAQEACNGEDEDCDGQPDETFACVQGVKGPCDTPCDTAGSATCGDDCTWGPCEPPTEDCNGVDDDCDLAVDEGCDCVAGTSGPCTTTCGSTGTRTCPDGTWSACAAPAESCNGDDDDCDGQIDDGFPCTIGQAETCTTACGSEGSRGCLDTCTWSACAAPREICNGEDDDCSNGPDDGYTCVQGVTGACTTGCGSTGTRSCSDICVWEDCVAPAEACNGADDDCDGTCDDGFACCQGGVASGCLSSCNTWGTKACNLGCVVAQSCTAPAEACNGRDDDCDATCDDGFACCLGRRTRCDVGQEGLLGLSLCKAGCLVGSCCTFTDVCGNGRDDDCDNAIDEVGCCDPGGVVSPEACDGMDNDCNGLCDDDPRFECCARTAEACTTSCNTNGTRDCRADCTWGTCTPPAEICGNHIDDDCDGLVDEPPCPVSPQGN